MQMQDKVQKSILKNGGSVNSFMVELGEDNAVPTRLVSF